MKRIKNQEKIKKVIYSVGALAICIAVLFSFWMSNKDNNIEPQNNTTMQTQPTTEERVVQNPITNMPDERYEPTETEKQKTSVYFSYPLGNKIAKEYSNGEIVKNKTTDDWRTHNGVDINGAKGDQVNAICDGEVIAVRDDPLWGTVVTIDHENGIVATYCGLEKSSVPEPGTKVKINQKIGVLHEIPIESADGVHLHLEIHCDGVTASPTAYLDKRIEF